MWYSQIRHSRVAVVWLARKCKRAAFVHSFAGESPSSSAAPSTPPTFSSTDRLIIDSSTSTVLFVITVVCILVAVAALTSVALVFCQKYSVLCFRKTFHHNLLFINRLGSFLPCDAMRCTASVIVIMSVCLSVCLSVCHTRGLCPHVSTYDYDFFTLW